MRQKVLLIDDSPAVHKIVRARLGEEGLEVFGALGGDDGVRMAIEVVPSLILLDVDMPAPDGFEVCRRLKREPATMDVPVVFLTGASTTAEKMIGLELGAVDYVGKPFDPAELRARVRSALRTKYLADLLANKAMVDGLTGLWNRGFFEKRLAAELSLARRTGSPVGLVLADVDRFRELNDGHGHLFGDRVLREIAVAMGAAVRAEDVLCRWSGGAGSSGGGAFAVLCPNGSSRGAESLAGRLRGAVNGLTFSLHGSTVSVTCSFGVTGVEDVKGSAAKTSEIAERLVAEAGDALRAAKELGRDRVCNADKLKLAAERGRPAELGEAAA